MLVFLLGITGGILLDFHLTTSVGQLIFDSSGNGYHSVLGSTLLEESTDAILTDRGAYFESGSMISMPPNNLRSSSFLPLSSTYLFTIILKPLGPGCILSITNGSETKLSLCWDLGILTVTQNGVSVSKSLVQGDFLFRHLEMGYFWV